MAKTQLIVIPVLEGFIPSEKTVIEAIEKCRAQKTLMDFNTIHRFQNHEEAAANAIKLDENQRYLIVTIEAGNSYTRNWQKKDPLWKDVCALVSFDVVDSINKEAVEPRLFSPKFRKLTLLRDYIIEPTPAKLSAFLNLIEPREVHPLFYILMDEKINSQQLLNARNAIEDELVKKQEKFDLAWTIVAVLTLSIAYWIRKAFFPSDGFVTKTFSSDEIGDAQQGLYNFWHYWDLRGYVLGYEDKTRYGAPGAQKYNDTTSYTENLLKDDMKFNKYGELKKHVIYNEATHQYKVIGTKQQIERLEFFQDYGKQCKQQKNTEDTTIRDELYPKVESRFFASVEESRTIVKEGDKSFRPR